MGHGKRDRLPCYQPVVLRPSAGGAQWQVEWLPISAERIIGGLGQGGMFLLQGLKLEDFYEAGDDWVEVCHAQHQLGVGCGVGGGDARDGHPMYTPLLNE